MAKVMCMRLYDVGEKERIQIIAKNEQASLQYTTTVVSNKQNFLFIEPVMYGGMIVNFNSSHVKISVVYVGEGGKPLVWDGCVIKNMTYQNKKYQVVFSDKEGKKFNRREAYRQYIGTRAILQSDITRDTWEVTVKDISTTGIAFVSNLSQKIGEIGAYHATFQDMDARVTVQVSGRIVRQADIDEKHRILGGVITKSNIELSNYIATKQKLENARRRGRA